MTIELSTAKLSDYFGCNRRFSRSVNLERDLDQVEAVYGYIPTDKACETLRQILGSILGKGTTKAWTITGVYGTGKSAFAHFLTALCAPEQSDVRQAALHIARESVCLQRNSCQKLIDRVPLKGYFRAVIAAQQEPLSHAIVRALEAGVKSFWQNPVERNQVMADLLPMISATLDGKKINTRKLLAVIRKIAKAAGTHVLLIVDELGKVLEYAAQYQGEDDLYLLQQLAELPKESDLHQIYFVGLLHQSFADYARRLTSVERDEWAKIQGRFSQIQFKESPQQMMQLMGLAIQQNAPKKLQRELSDYATRWYKALSNQVSIEGVTETLLASVYPLHSIATLVLPELCIDYAQNDRSLFTFLTGNEPYSLQTFLKQVEITYPLPTLKLDYLYDYFVEAIGLGMAMMPNLQRWLEIQARITDARYSDPDPQRDLDVQRMLKAIGVLNLVTTGGELRAGRGRVTLAMCDDPIDVEQQRYWNSIIDHLIEKKFIIEYQTLDEIRIWQGSEYDIEEELADYVAKAQTLNLAQMLKQAYPLKPLVAQRHSYATGTLRYFERRYLDRLEDLDPLQCDDISERKCDRPDSDGLIGYWVGENLETEIVAKTTLDAKPFILISSTEIGVLRIRAIEFSALKEMLDTIPRLQTDIIARREVEYRFVQAEKLFYETLNRLFNPANSRTTCWIEGQRSTLAHATALNEMLSRLCDDIYSEGLVLWNELINRRELTSQGAKARRELLEAMLTASDQPQLGLSGNGPEVTIYASVLQKTGIHREGDEGWGFYPPTELTVLRVWNKIDEFCKQAKTKPQSLKLLYDELQAPPYGVKQGVIPVILAAVLLYRADDVSLYRENTFIPVLGAEHFELLVRNRGPEKFAVKYVRMQGLRIQVFRNLEREIVRGGGSRKSTQERNATLLSVVKPLLKFAKSLHPFTRQTQLITAEAQAVLKALLRGQEPDRLLFQDLPIACSMEPLAIEAENDLAIAQELCTRLVTVLRELRDAYDVHLLNRCEKLLCDAFSENDEAHWRENLRVRSRQIKDKCIDNKLRHFLIAAVEEHKEPREWLESLLFSVLDKPLTRWIDADISAFELALSQRLKLMLSLEVLQKQVEQKQLEQQGKAFRAFKFTLTANNGNELDDVAIIEQGKMETDLEAMAQEILSDNRLGGDSKRQKALLAIMARQLLNMDAHTVNELAAQRSRQHSRSVSQQSNEVAAQKTSRRKRRRTGDVG